MEEAPDDWPIALMPSIENIIKPSPRYENTRAMGVNKQGINLQSIIEILLKMYVVDLITTHKSNYGPKLIPFLMAL